MSASTQAAWMARLVAGLAAGGVTDVVISPGSRSTPILLAVLRAGAFATHDVIDERAAAFFALGLARAGRLPALVCTSGSAPGHYLPAVMEASASRIPLVIVSANRPPELHDTGANQTTDQARLFGSHVRAFVDLGAAHESERAMAAAERRVLRAVTCARGLEPGPVHVDVGARKPLEEPAAVAGDERAAARAPAVYLPRAQVSRDALDAIAARLEGAARVAFVAGPGGLGQRSWRAPVARLVGAIGGVLVADAGSQLRFTGCALALDGGEAVMRTERGRALLDADLVVQLGESPLGSGFAAWAKGRDRVVIAEGGWPDPEGDAALFAFGDVEGALEALAAQLAETTPRPPERTPDLRGHLEAAVAAARADALEGPLSQPAAVRAAVEACPEGAALVLGNSLPIRAVDLYVGRDVALDVVVQRGLSGIDGFVAGSAAHARASARPTLAVLGDVTFAHDLGSLLLARGLDSPLVFFVPNDGGGRIFEQLPVHEVLDAAAFERHFAMDHGLSFDGAAALYGLRYVRASAEAEIRAAVAEGLERPGATIVEAKVPPESARLVGRRFVAALGARLEEAP